MKIKTKPFYTPPKPSKPHSRVMYAEWTESSRKGICLRDGTRTPPYLEHFYPTIMQVEMCGDYETPQDIVRVLVTPDPKGTYWAWYDYEDAEIVFVYFWREALEMAFTYGSKAEEEYGKGKIIRVRVEILPE